MLRINTPAGTLPRTAGRQPDGVGFSVTRTAYLATAGLPKGTGFEAGQRMIRLRTAWRGLRRATSFRASPLTPRRTAPTTLWPATGGHPVRAAPTGDGRQPGELPRQGARRAMAGGGIYRDEGSFDPVVPGVGIPGGCRCDHRAPTFSAPGFFPTLHTFNELATLAPAATSTWCCRSGSSRAQLPVSAPTMKSPPSSTTRTTATHRASDRYRDLRTSQPRRWRSRCRSAMRAAPTPSA